MRGPDNKTLSPLSPVSQPKMKTHKRVALAQWGIALWTICYYYYYYCIAKGWVTLTKVAFPPFRLTLKVILLRTWHVGTLKYSLLTSANNPDNKTLSPVFQPKMKTPLLIPHQTTPD